MDKTIIIVLGVVLIILIILNHVSVVKTSNGKQATCSQTAYGCCPNGIDSKMNYYGTNCPGYQPIPGYQQPGTPYLGPGTPVAGPGTTPYVPGTPVAGPGTPVAGPGTTPYVPGTPVAGPGTPVAGPGTAPYAGPGNPPPPPGPGTGTKSCVGSPYGCCLNNQTPKANQAGTNC